MKIEELIIGQRYIAVNPAGESIEGLLESISADKQRVVLATKTDLETLDAKSTTWHFIDLPEGVIEEM